MTTGPEAVRPHADAPVGASTPSGAGASTIPGPMASSREFGSIRHLAGRFFGALLPLGRPSPTSAGPRTTCSAG